GVMMTDLNAEQKELLNSIVVLYAERLRPEMAADDLGKILKAGVDKVDFAWAGGLALCPLYDPHYVWTRFWGAGPILGTRKSAMSPSFLAYSERVKALCPPLSSLCPPLFFQLH
ncbi:MAG: DUF3500 domain-containing protein, partial [Paludisphaera borealis]|uniref:DUF3500 domain-containing protein n=1 Tax=Paludisphaera borealis TaxID=1387353 RepID=UPI00284E3EFC